MKLHVVIAIFGLFVSVAFGSGKITEVPLEQVQQILDKPVASHPRLFLNDQKLAEVMRKIEASDDLKVLRREFLKQADELLTKPPLKRIKTGRRLLSVSREALRRLFVLSWAYRTSGDEKYLTRAEQEMLAIAEFSDWNPSHFLDVAEMTMAFAVGYDWLYNGLSASSRETIRRAIVEKGIRPSLYENRSTGWWINTHNNWNQVCHGGLTCGVLAIMEDEPELARTVIHRSVNKIQIAMREYEPHGAYPEGPGYWVYGTTYNVLLIEALESVFGTDFGLSAKHGFVKSADYFLHAIGPTGWYYNYADCGLESGFTPAVLWFAKRYNNSSLLWYQEKRWDGLIKQEPSSLTQSRISVMSLLWGAPEATRPERLSWVGLGRNPVAMFRTSWDDDAVYLGIKGGSPGSHHAHMDAGSFVIEADGIRWAMDLERESYHRVESLGIRLFDMEQDGDRWKIFRNNNYSHNTLTVDGQLQQVNGFAPIVRYSDDSDFSHVVIDLTQIYDGQLKKAIRGAALLPSGQILVQDELQATNQPATVRWKMVTPAQVNIQSDTFAILSRKQKSMQFRVVTDADIKLATYSTEPRSHLDSENEDTRMIGFDVELAPDEKIMFREVERWSTPLDHFKQKKNK